MKIKVIVTVGLRFIGSNLIELLIKKKYFVINIDCNTYSSNYYNTKDYKKNYKFIKCNINNKKKFLIFYLNISQLLFLTLLPKLM